MDAIFDDRRFSVAGDNDGYFGVFHKEKIGVSDVLQ